MTIEEFRQKARAWLETVALRKDARQAGAWGEGVHDVSVFKALSHDDEKALIAREAAWEAAKVEHGFGAITWPIELGGAGLDHEYETAYRAEEAQFDVPRGHELLLVTVKLVAPTLRDLGTPAQVAGPARAFVGGEQLCCQLFSEPSAGSDLASLATRARMIDGRWVVSGQKVWSSGAHFADYGLLIARTDPDVVKHAGLTAFLVPLDTPGIEIRPIQQMSGGQSFCEVFLDEVVLDDSTRVGEVGDGWKVALMVLGFERESSDGSGGVGGTWGHVLQLAEWSGGAELPVARQQLADVYIRERVNEISGYWDAARRAAGEDLGASGSLRKLQWVGLMASISDAVAEILGERLTADTGEWGTFTWNDHVLGALGYSIAGGSDQIQRNIIAERLLGMPPEPRADRGVAWKDTVR